MRTVLLIFLLVSSTYAGDLPIALTHIDTISVYCQKIKSNNIQVDFLNYEKPMILSTAIWIPRYVNGATKALEYTKELRNCILKKIDGKENILVVKDNKDINTALKEKKIAIIFTLEGGEPLEDISNIKILNDLEIKGVSLTWSRDNSLACAHNTKKDTGLSKKGIDAVRELNRYRIMIDVSHSSDKTIEDILKISSAPVYASHSNSRSICPNNRNLTDEQIKKIALKGGVIGINFHSPHLSCSSKSSVEDIYKHIKHIRDIAGHKSIVLGSDFDGDIKNPIDIKGINDIKVLIKKLKLENWTEAEIEDILYRNFVRYFNMVSGEQR